MMLSISNWCCSSWICCINCSYCAKLVMT